MEHVMCVISIVFYILFLLFFILWLVISINTEDLKGPIKAVFRTLDKECTYISFKTFINMKNIAPNKWSEGTYDYVIYHSDGWHYKLYMKTVPDVFRLYSYRRSKRKNKIAVRDLETSKELIEMWKEDLKKFEEENYGK